MNRDSSPRENSPQSAVVSSSRSSAAPEQKRDGPLTACECAYGAQEAAEFLLAYADWLSAHLEEWTLTNRGELVAGKPRHYVRITPADPNQPDQVADPDNGIVQITNGGGKYPARNVVSLDFLELVRLGVRSAHDPLIADSVAVIDAVLKRDLPQGPCWRRYNHDGYGQKDDGSAFDGTGTGRCWPLLTGERGHYELAAGRDPMPFIRALENFANEGGMLPEQVWDAEDLPQERMFRGAPTGSAMPLCWAHAEYLTLVRSRRDGVGFDSLPPVYERYAQGPKTQPATGDRLPGEGAAERPETVIEIWTLARQPPRIAKGRALRIVIEKQALIRWSSDGWKTAKELQTAPSGIGCWYVDVPCAGLPAGAIIEFTFRWQDRWEGRNFQVGIA